MKLLIENWRKFLEEEEVLVEKCWDGYKQVGLKKKGDRMVPNCVPVGGKTNEGFEDLEDMRDLENVIVTVNDDGKLVIPPSGNAEIDIIASEILSTLEPSDLKGKYRKLQKEKKCNKLTGHCFVATEVFWELTKRLEKNYNYVPCFIKHEGDSHWFAKNLSNGHIVDLTAGQFETIPNYNMGKCDTEEKANASRYMMRRKDPYDPSKTTPTKRTLDVLSRMDDKK